MERPAQLPATLALLALASSALAAGPGAKGAVAESPMAVARRMAAEYRTAMMKKDVAYFQSHGAKGFTYVERGKTANMEQAIAGLKQGFQMMKSVDSMDQKIVSAKTAEGGVVYVSDIKMTATLNMPSAKDKKKMAKMNSTLRTETLVVKEGGMWKFKRAKVVSSKDLMDGKPMPGMG